jgi:pimeloyl-ACP methyl ester carboxylesterase
MEKNKSLFTSIDGMNISYTIQGEGDINIIFLHGWGVNKEAFNPIIERMTASNQYKLISIDFPGFGESDMPNQPVGTSTYADWTIQFIQKLGLDKVNLIGHSFGGRVSIRIASNQTGLVEKVILIDSAGVKSKLKLKHHLKVQSYKFAKAFIKLVYRKEKFEQKIEELRKKFGSEDYRKSNPIMRQVLIKTVNEDLSDLLPDIKAPTLIIWGEKDTETPLWMGEKMEKLIPDAGLVTFKGSGHYSYLEKPDDFVIITNKFFLG